MGCNSQLCKRAVHIHNNIQYQASVQNTAVHMQLREDKGQPGESQCVVTLCCEPVQNSSMQHSMYPFTKHRGEVCFQYLCSVFGGSRCQDSGDDASQTFGNTIDGSSSGEHEYGHYGDDEDGGWRKHLCEFWWAI